MSYDEAVEAAAEAIGDVLGFEYSRLQNGPMARAAINAALPHLRNGYDREAIARAVKGAIDESYTFEGALDPSVDEAIIDAVIEVLPPLPDTTTRTVYSVQQWVDADGIRDSWCTGYGHFTHNRDDAEATLAYDRRTYPAETFRLAQAQITDWQEVSPDAPTDSAPNLEVPADDASAVGEPPEHVVEAVARWLHGRFGAAWWAAWSCATESFRGELRTAARDVLAVARDAEKEANR